jgi:hypothetical protein
MSQSSDIQDQLRDTRAALAEFDAAMRSNASPPESLLLVGASLRKRLAQLEKEYAATSDQLDVTRQQPARAG